MDLLKKNLPVRALFRNEESIQKSRAIFSLYGEEMLQKFELIDCCEGELNDIQSLEEAMKNVDYVFHCAAMVSFKRSKQDEMFKVNVEGTANLVNVCLKAKIKKLCHVSSTAAVGSSAKKEAITEKNTWKKTKYTSNYGITKYQAEMEVWRGMEEGLDVVIVNPSIIIGPGDWNSSSAELFAKVWKGLKFFTIGKTAFVDVRDVSRAMIDLLHSEVKNERFLLCSENWTYQQLFQEIAQALQKKEPYIRVRSWFLGIIWRLEAIRSFVFGTSPVVTKETAHSSMEVKLYDGSKIEKAIPFQYTPIREAIQHTGKLFLSAKPR